MAWVLGARLAKEKRKKVALLLFLVILDRLISVMVSLLLFVLVALVLFIIFKTCLI